MVQLRRCYSKICMLLLLGFLTNPLIGQISNDGLLAYYSFDGNTNDSGPGGFNGIMNGGQFGADAEGNTNAALLLNGINDYVNISSFASTFRKNLGDISIFFKVKFMEQRNNQTILSLGNSGEDLFTKVFEVEYEHREDHTKRKVCDYVMNNISLFNNFRPELDYYDMSDQSMEPFLASIQKRSVLKL